MYMHLPNPFFSVLGREAFKLGGEIQVSIFMVLNGVINTCGLECKDC